MKRQAAVFLTLFAILPTAAQTQTDPSLRSGDRIRVTAPECALQEARGTLISLEDRLFSATLGTGDVE